MLLAFGIINGRLRTQLIGQPLQLRQPPLSCPNLSPAYPSRGGADCSYECHEPGTKSVYAGYFNVFSTSFNDRISRVGRLIQNHGPRGSTIYVEGEHGFMDSHITFAYYCCQTESERARIKAVLEGWEHWPAEEVGFSYVTCAVDGPAIDHVSLILMLDEQSNDRMYRLVERVEATIEAQAGVRLNIRRREQEPFHMTLAVVNGTTYPVGKAVAALNEAWPSWESVRLTKPCEAHGTTPAGFFC